jgi:hypothetical protein
MFYGKIMERTIIKICFLHQTHDDKSHLLHFLVQFDRGKNALTTRLCLLSLGEWVNIFLEPWYHIKSIISHVAVFEFPKLMPSRPVSLAHEVSQCNGVRVWYAANSVILARLFPHHLSLKTSI